MNSSAAQAWESIKALAKDAGVEVPQVNPQHAASEARLRKARAAKRLAKSQTISAEDVQLVAGHFCTMSGQPATVLSAIRPGVEGIYLADHDKAVEVLAALRGVVVEDLAVLVVGHRCPDPGRCSGQLAFPVTAKRNGASLLLAGCLHQVGTAPIKPHLASSATVDLPEVCICLFELYAKEFETDVWTRVTQAPARVVQELFLEGGVVRTFTDPWARRHFLHNRPSQPDLADKITFLGKVAEADLVPLLVASGHNGIYITPRDVRMSLAPGFSILWTGPHGQDALKASLLIAEQRGLVQARGRYGVRVPAAEFDKIHQQLRLGLSVPRQLSISAVTGWALSLPQRAPHRSRSGQIAWDGRFES